MPVPIGGGDGLGVIGKLLKVIRHVNQRAAAWGGGGWASSRPVSGMVSGIIPGWAGGGWSGRAGAGARVSVRRRSKAAVTAQMARAAMTSTVRRAIAV